MTAQFQEALAAKLGLSEEERTALQNGDPTALLSRSLSGASDPMALIMMAALMQGQQQESRERPESASERTIERAKTVIRQLREELTAKETMLQYVAQVFGVCPACLGQNRLCLRCGGQGKPGASDPLEEELLRWTVPALKRVGRRVVPLERQPKGE